MYISLDAYATETITDNVIQPFQLESSRLRGRIVRLGSVLDDILNPHAYPAPVNQLLGETVTMCALLSSMLKYEGVFTLQTQGDGPVPMLISDMTTDGDIRGCASFDSERLVHAAEQLAAFEAKNGTADNQFAQLLGKGYIAFTVDQGGPEGRYQGIVELKGASLVDCVQHYFGQSEQINTGIIMAVGQREGKWRAQGIMLQIMPEENEAKGKEPSNLHEDDWRRAMILMQSCTEDELLDPALTPHTILTRLFHEEGVRVYEPQQMKKSCRCSREKVESVLMMMPEDDREYMEDKGTVTLTCEFCNTHYEFDAKEIEEKIKERGGVSPV